MSVPSPKAAAIRLLRNDLYEHLDEAEHLAQEPWTSARADQARAVIDQLVTVVRGMIVAHDADAGNRCRTCEIPWPCPTLDTVHRLVKDPDGELFRIINAVRERA